MRARGSGLVEKEEQDENKRMRSIVVEEQEQEQEQEGESETGFVDLDRCTLQHVLKRVDVVTLGRAACVNKMWRRAAWDNQHYLQRCTRMNPWYRVPRFVLEQGEGSETGFGDLKFDTLLNVLKRVDVVTLGRAACVNKMWCTVTWDNRIWQPMVEMILYNTFLRSRLDFLRRHRKLPYRLVLSEKQISDYIKGPPDFYSIDPQVFSSQIGPWV